MQQNDAGLIGLAVMGQNLARNIDRNGFALTVHNRTAAKTDEFLHGPAQGTAIRGAGTLKDLVAGLKRPRKILLMVQAGQAVDAVLDELAPLLDPGDLVMDGGNSHYRDTARRAEQMEGKGLLYLGVGVSGGEEGALLGPSLMPGGQRRAWELARPLLEPIAARAADGTPCVAYMGPSGAGHFVKMIHNGIEYGDMQLIAEVYDLMTSLLDLSAPEQAEVFAGWNQGPLASFLIEVAANVLAYKDPDTGRPLVDLILDKAGHKGTGRWTIESALELGAAAPTLTAAMEARILSGVRDERLRAAALLAGPELSAPPDRGAFIADLEQALYAAKICSYAQGFAILSAASRQWGWDLDLGEAARVWRAGCIIRAAFLDDVTQAFRADPAPANLLLAPFFTQALADRHQALRRVAAASVTAGVPTPALTASLAYYDAFRSARLPANLIQAQRDYFGAHTYQRIDRDGVFHTQWTV